MKLKKISIRVMRGLTESLPFRRQEPVIRHILTKVYSTPALRDGSSAPKLSSGDPLALTSSSASDISSVVWVRSFGFFHVFGAVIAV